MCIHTDTHARTHTHTWVMKGKKEVGKEGIKNGGERDRGEKRERERVRNGEERESQVNHRNIQYTKITFSFKILI